MTWSDFSPMDDDQIIRKLAEPHGDLWLNHSILREDIASTWIQKRHVGQRLFPGGSVLHWAAWNGNPHLVRLLLKHGAAVNAAGGEGQTALHMAAEGRHTGIVEMLLNAGADLNLTDKTGATVLHQAAINTGKLYMARLLLDHGAELDTRDDRGRTALDRAFENGDSGLVNIFLNAQVEKDTEGMDSHTAEQSTVTSGYDAIDEILRSDDISPTNEPTLPLTTYGGTSSEGWMSPPIHSPRVDPAANMQVDQGAEKFEADRIYEDLGGAAKSPSSEMKMKAGTTSALLQEGLSPKLLYANPGKTSIAPASDLELPRVPSYSMSAPGHAGLALRSTGTENLNLLTNTVSAASGLIGVSTGIGALVYAKRQWQAVARHHANESDRPRNRTSSATDSDSDPESSSAKCQSHAAPFLEGTNSADVASNPRQGPVANVTLPVTDGNGTQTSRRQGKGNNRRSQCSNASTADLTADIELSTFATNQAHPPSHKSVVPPPHPSPSFSLPPYSPVDSRSSPPVPANIESLPTSVPFTPPTPTHVQPLSSGLGTSPGWVDLPVSRHPQEPPDSSASHEQSEETYPFDDESATEAKKQITRAIDSLRVKDVAASVAELRTALRMLGPAH